MIAEQTETLPRRWRLHEKAPDEHFARFPQYPRFLVQLAYNRGATDAAALRVLLDGQPATEPDLALMPDLARAVERIVRARAAGERIAVYGDFDLDGVSGAAVLTETLRGGGIDPVAYIPHRGEGHGLNIPAIAWLADQGVTLIISADCGTNDRDEAAFAAGRGVDLIVTDHHACHGRPSPAAAVINPNRPDSAYPFGGMAGVGVAFQLARALIAAGLAGQVQEDDLLDLVALGTVADVAPLTGPNREWVRRGLPILAERRRPGLRALLDLIRLGPDPLTPFAVAFQIAPRFNAMGRLDHAGKSLELLITRDDRRAVELAAELDRVNRDRQAQLAAANARLTDLPDQTAPRLPLPMIEDPELPEPLLGLLASRLVADYGRPAIVIRWEARVCRASARAPAGYDLAGLLGQCSSLLNRFGGHAQAAGFSVSADRVGELRERLMSLVPDSLGPAEPEILIDLDVDLRHHNRRILEGIQRLAPFGQANPEPVFLSQRVRVVQSRRFGSDDRHLRLKLFDDRHTWEAVAFNRGRDWATLPSRIHLVYHLRDHCWNGERSLQLHVLDLVPADGGSRQ